MATRVSVALAAALAAVGSANPQLRGVAVESEVLVVNETTDNATDDGNVTHVWVDAAELEQALANESAVDGDVDDTTDDKNRTITQELALWGWGGWTNPWGNTGGSTGYSGNTYSGGGNSNHHGHYNGGSSHHSGGGGSCGGSDKVVDASDTCAASENYHCGGCYIYRQCKGRHTCVLNGYMIAPGEPLRGMEDISGGNAGKWDYLWSAAEHQCGSDSCVLISNPIHFRTQHQMHLHYRHYNGGGASLKSRLESTLCGTSGWQPFEQCGAAKARLYDSMPGVFSAVAGAYGGGNLANVGITVWFTSKCGGRKVMILAQTGCSIEHGISAR